VNDDFRSRVIMPILLPIAVLVAIGGFVGAVAAILLFNTKSGALMLAAVAAAGILFTVSLASSQDKLDAPRRGVVVFAAVLPLLVGALLSAGVIGDIDDEDRMVNVQPLFTVPEAAPVIGAVDSQDFCLYDEAGTCVTTQTWEVTPDPEEEMLSFVFQNDEPGVPHNVVITSIEGSVDDPGIGDEEFVNSAIVTGIVTDYYVSDELTWDDLPDDWYFYCAVHPNMNGVGSVVGDA
jgi:hypothetical protein